jgi:hypothetical protein
MPRARLTLPNEQRERGDQEEIADDVKRFILVSVHSVPYLEALLLLRGESARDWDSKQVARRLYMSEKAASELLSQLYAAEVLVTTEPQGSLYRYRPASDELRQMVEQLAQAYSTNLVEVSNLIHSKLEKKAQLFADAFKWRKDS